MKIEIRLRCVNEVVRMNIASIINRLIYAFHPHAVLYMWQRDKFQREVGKCFEDVTKMKRQLSQLGVTHVLSREKDEAKSSWSEQKRRERLKTSSSAKLTRHISASNSVVRPSSKRLRTQQPFSYNKNSSLLNELIAGKVQQIAPANPQKLYLKQRVSFLKKAIQSQRQKLEQTSLRCNLLINATQTSKTKLKACHQRQSSAVQACESLRKETASIISSTEVQWHKNRQSILRRQEMEGEVDQLEMMVDCYKEEILQERMRIKTIKEDLKAVEARRRQLKHTEEMLLSRWRLLQNGLSQS